jgi:hypothetical protein
LPIRPPGNLTNELAVLRSDETHLKLRATQKMKFFFTIAALTALGPFWSPAAWEAHNYIWHVYHDDEPTASLAMVDQAEVDAEDAYWPFFMRCSLGEPWTAVISGIDAKELGNAIATHQPVGFSFVVDGKTSDDEGGRYVPELSFSQLDGEWNYLIEWDFTLLNRLARANTLAIRGTGLDKSLPSEGLAAAFTWFEKVCGSFDDGRNPIPDLPAEPIGRGDGGA